MMNILILMAGKSLYFSENEFPFPKPLIEIGSKTMIERVIENLNSNNLDVQFTFVLRNADCRKYHLDSTLNIITHNKCNIIRLDNETKGAACSALMAVRYISNDFPLIIANPDQLFDVSFSDLIFELIHADAGVVTFESVHPRWSYVRVDENGFVLETAEKRPISRDAIAGLYYFRKGKEFVKAAMLSMEKDASVNGDFYIAPTLNEFVLQGKMIKTVKIENERYHTFYTPQKVKEFEAKIIHA